MTRGVVRMRLGVDKEEDRQRSDFFHRFQDHAGIRRTMTAVDQHHAVLGDHDAAIGIEVIADVHVDAFFDLFNIGWQVLRVSDASSHEIEGSDDDRKLQLHTFLQGEK